VRATYVSEDLLRCAFSSVLFFARPASYIDGSIGMDPGGCLVRGDCGDMRLVLHSEP
jgi:hypothetical protein